LIVVGIRRPRFLSDAEGVRIGVKCGGLVDIGGAIWSSKSSLKVKVEALDDERPTARMTYYFNILLKYILIIITLIMMFVIHLV